MLNLTKDLEIAKEKRVHIHLNSDYKWGRGWTEEESKRFDNEVLSAFKEAGYTVKEEKSSFSSPTLTKGGSRLNIYMHPMDFSGYATQEEIDEILEILSSCECVSVRDVLTEDIYDLNNWEYKNLLAKNAKEILVLAKEAKKKRRLSEFAFDFAKSHRVPRYGDSGALTSDDVDISFIETFCKIAEGLDLL